jgi:hypothetical protein
LNEVAEARRIKEIDLILVPLAESELGGDSDSPFDFFVIVIRRGVAIVYAPKAIGCAGIEKDRGNK